MASRFEKSWEEFALLMVRKLVNGERLRRRSQCPQRTIGINENVPHSNTSLPTFLKRHSSWVSVLTHFEI